VGEKGRQAGAWGWCPPNAECSTFGGSREVQSFATIARKHTKVDMAEKQGSARTRCPIFRAKGHGGSQVSKKEAVKLWHQVDLVSKVVPQNNQDSDRLCLLLSRRRHLKYILGRWQLFSHVTGDR
jgi:hypothetical protein